MSETLAIAVLALVSAVMAYKLLKAERSMRELKAFVEELRRGRLGSRLYLKSGNSYSLLMRNLSMLASDLEEKTQEARSIRNRFNSVLNGIPEGFVLIDAKERVQFVNPAFEETFGAKGGDVRGRPVVEASGIAELGPLLRKARNTGDRLSAEFRDPHGKYVQAIVKPMLGPDEDGAAILLRDITERRKLDEVKRDFVANVSHELKTPITAIKGFTETLIDGALEDRKNAEKFLNTVRFHSERMERLVGDLITLSELEMSASPLNRSQVSLETGVSKALDLVKQAAGDKGLALEKEMHDECVEVNADPDRLMQVLVNLLDNAIKFTTSGRVAVRTRKEGGACVLEVEDSGIGIAAKYIPRLGERFFRVDPTHSRETVSGTGLGLAIVKHIVAAHGWEMVVKSDLGRGTTVEIFME